MATRDLQALLTALGDDESLRAALGAATTAEEVVRIAADHGYEVRADDLLVADTAAAGELTDAELDPVAGGTPIMSVMLAPGLNVIYC